MNQRSSLIAALTMIAACVASSCSRANDQANDEAEINASVQRLGCQC